MDMLKLWRATMHAQGLSTRTITERISAVESLANHAGTSVELLEPVHVLEWLGRQSLSQATRATYYGHLRAFAEWQRGIGAHADLLAGVPIPRRRRCQPRPVTKSELAAILAACNRRRTRQYVMFAAYGGLRVSEIAKLARSDFHHADGGMTLDVVGKGNQLARVPVVDTLARMLAELPADGWLFPSATSPSGHVRGQAVSKAISCAMQRAGVAGTPHALRHFFGTELLESCGNLRVVQSLMRHESIASTQIYTRVSEQRQRDALAALAA